MRMSCMARGPDLLLEGNIKKEILLIDMACSNDFNKDGNKRRRQKKYQQIGYEL